MKGSSPEKGNGASEAQRQQSRVLVITQNPDLG